MTSAKTSPIKNIPTILVAFGATGDLMKKKIIPALFHLFIKGEIPKMFRVVGFSRREMSDGDFQKYAKEILENHFGKKADEGVLNSFLSFFRYQKGQFQGKENYDGLQKTLSGLDAEWGVCANKLFYLAVAPEFYETIFKELSQSGLAKPCSGKDEEDGWVRIIVEKPFGQDLKTAEALDELLGKLFKETQIYRIDHYLAKEMLQNILNFRFANNLFEFGWGNKTIENIDIRLHEKIGVEKRGAFYDGVGALRDVGQNHLLQMLALATMDNPASFDAESIRSKRAEILEALEILSKEEIKTATFRAQYEGYKEIAGVAPDSQTETYFRVRASLSSPRWRGVPITMDGGKRLGEPLKEIVITFKHPEPCLCGSDTVAHHKNTITIRMEPKEEILIEFWSKKPGLSMESEKRTFNFLLRETGAQAQYIEEYEKLLLDCVRGDQTLFVSTREIKSMWRYTDAIVSAWKENIVPLETYKPDTKDILKQLK